jgi:hypothetical protein
MSHFTVNQHPGKRLEQVFVKQITPVPKGNRFKEYKWYGE